MKSKVIIAILVSSIILFAPKAKAATFENNKIVTTNKVWTIHFNKEVLFDNLSKQDIVVEDSNGTKLNVTLKLGDDGKSIIVSPPDNGYQEGNSYKLIIGDKVHSKDNKNIKQQSVMNFSIEKSTEDEVVTFKDVNLEKVVRDTIKKPTGTLYEADVDKITQLEGEQKNIKYLDGIEKLRNLKNICLISNRIRDITPLKGLTQLNYLIFGENQIEDISPLSELVNLKSLSLQNNKISNVDSLSKMTNLESLDLNDNKIQDISALNGLKKLSNLYLENNKVNSVKALEGLSSLELLDLNNNEISDIEPLQNLINLNGLSISSNKIVDISSLVKLTNLRSLNIQDNLIKDISILPSMTKLGSIGIKGNFYDNVECLKQMKNLFFIDETNDLNKYFKIYDKASYVIKNIIKPEMSDLDKEKAVHDYIVKNTSYDVEAYNKLEIRDDDDNPYGVLINGKAICSGYAEATKLLLNMSGIKCITVIGEASINDYDWISHEWNIVQIGGKYYQLDTTFDDPTPDEPGVATYDYFNVNDDKMSINHMWDSSKYPECN